MTTILQLGNPVLRQVSEPVIDFFDSSTQQIIGTMQDALANSQGVGLAAPQIGILQRIIIVASKPTLRYPRAPLMSPTVMINPSYQVISATLQKDWEGCLSIPGIRALVPRHSIIEINYQNDHGEYIQQKLEGFLARIFQHEIDHLDGWVYLDRVESSRDIVTEQEYQRLMQKDNYIGLLN